jgi:flagellar motor switch protein FliG
MSGASPRIFRLESAMPDNSLRKAAVLLTSLPEEDAVPLLAKLSPKQVELVSIEIARLQGLTLAEQDQVINDFADANPAAFGLTGGGIDRAKALVEKALGDKASPAIENLRNSIESRPFSFLKKVDPQNVLTFIMDEHPQTIALILSHLPPQFGAEIIKGLSADRQLAVIRRIAHMGQTNPEVIREVEQGLESRMANLTSQSFENAGGVDSVAEILNVTDRAIERSLLENLQQEDPQLVDEIRRLMFVFEDIAKLSNKDVQTVLKNVETSQWAMALKGTSENLKQKVLGNMSTRAAATLREEMEFLGAVKQSEVEKVQQQIVDVVRKLEDLGQLSTQPEESAEELVS